jgi:hypothetical protein
MCDLACFAVCLLSSFSWNLPYSVARHRVELAFEEALELLDNEWAGHLGLYIGQQPATTSCARSVGAEECI